MKQKLCYVILNKLNRLYGPLLFLLIILLTCVQSDTLPFAYTMAVSESEITPTSLYSALLLTRALWTLGQNKVHYIGDRVPHRTHTIPIPLDHVWCESTVLWWQSSFTTSHQNIANVNALFTVDHELSSLTID